MSSQNKVFIVIVNYNNTKDTINCLNSLNNLKPQNYSHTPLLVDNGSDEKVVTTIQKEFPRLQIIRSQTNLGFAGGNNLGIRYAQNHHADYVFLINNDTIIKDPLLIDKLINTKADITSPVVRFQKHGSTVYDYGGKIDPVFARHTHLESSTLKPPTDQPDYLSGVSLLIKAEVFKRIGLLDDRYFLYYEDADFCLRAKKANFTIRSCHSTYIDHKLSQSANKLGKKKLQILAQSQWLFARAHLSPLFLPTAFAYHQYLLFKARYLT